MNRALGGRLGPLRERYSDPLLTLLTVLLLILLFVVAPLQASGIIVFQAFGVAVGLIMIATVLVLSGSLVASMTVLVALCMNVAVIVLRLRNQPTSIDLHLVASAWLLISVTLGWVVARAVFGAGAVNYHRVIGAVLLYLLIALTFVALFVFVGLFDPKAFSGIAFEDTPALASNLIYFSFVTLTTVGYGDIVPVHPVARSLCNLESISGQLFPATLLARLVTLELEQRR